ncbi:hypothetical protein CUJ83_07740 [Methanocella sp. CWC-04]|uniref:Uncharacterized protein n=1 Tax=Methanooceanicella nereidis TaxID=2052831 RepID=A0AAP2RCH8_9EURY|nr:hypothetical protein [Methanocella sp. CWC-04]MCD1294888.1 hypothetical protein [Methanocella sp. CWC-04]
MFTKSQKLVYAFALWVFVILALLAVFQSLNYEYFFVLCLIGFLILVELSGPFTTKPKWRSRVNIVIFIGLLMFSFIVIKKVLDILGIGI